MSNWRLEIQGRVPPGDDQEQREREIIAKTEAFLGELGPEVAIERAQAGFEVKGSYDFLGEE